jgi:hypothetical protein
MRYTPKKNRLVSTSATAMSVLVLGAVVAVSRRSEAKAEAEPTAPRRGTALSTPLTPEVLDMAPVRDQATATRGTNRHLRRGSKLVLALGTATALLAAVGTGTAFAYFVGGTGSGSGTAATGQALTITATAATLSGTLYPGATSDLVVTITNPYPNMTMVVASAVAEGTLTESGGTGTCSNGNTGVNVTTPSGITNGTIPASTSKSVTLSGAIQMTSSSPNGCQGATFTVPVAVTTKVG